MLCKNNLRKSQYGNLFFLNSPVISFSMEPAVCLETVVCRDLAQEGSGDQGAIFT